MLILLRLFVLLLLSEAIPSSFSLLFAIFLPGISRIEGLSDSFYSH
jgi:hypothetical protein